VNDLQLDRRPLYAQAHDWLLRLIREGEFEPGDQLPSETELASQIGISRATLREALRLLEDEGIIVRRQGVGTFVTTGPHLESGLERLESVFSLADQEHMQTRIDHLSVDSVPADRTLAEQLQVEGSTPITRVRRTVLIENEPVAYMEDLIPALWLSPQDIDQHFNGSVLDLLRRRQPGRVQEALADITAVQANRALARQLGVRRGTALLLLEETLFDAEGQPVGFSRNYFVPDRFRFHVVRR
jgi:GntR family transcriptional regulator